MGLASKLRQDAPPPAVAIPSAPPLEHTAPPIDFLTGSYTTSPTYPPAPDYSTPPSNYAAPPTNYTAPPTNYATPPNYTAPPTNYTAPPTNYAAPPSSYAAAPPTNYTAPLESKIRSIIQANSLQAFYDEAKIRGVLQRLATVDFDNIARRWKMTKELAYDLCALALYDIVFYCDDSSSMVFEEGGERVEDLKLVVSQVADVVGLFDSDGMSIRLMNSNQKADGVRTSTEAVAFFNGVNFSGCTPLGTNFHTRVIEPMVLSPVKKFLGMSVSKGLEKPVLAFIITDGEPAGESRNTIIQVLNNARTTLLKSKYGERALAVQIAQVGKDERARQFLAEVDNDPTVGHMIDCTSHYEQEAEEFAKKGVTLTPELWILKMCLGAIDPEYDDKD